MNELGYQNDESSIELRDEIINIQGNNIPADNLLDNALPADYASSDSPSSSESDEVIQLVHSINIVHYTYLWTAI